jgi:sugar phosphate isomerase/epimerase
MRLGIFAKTFARPTVEDVLGAVRAHGLDCVQFNMACARLPSMPERIKAAVCDRIRNAAVTCGVTLAALSGTFNMIHPDPEERRAGLMRWGVLAGG